MASRASPDIEADSGLEILSEVERLLSVAFSQCEHQSKEDKLLLAQSLHKLNKILDGSEAAMHSARRREGALVEELREARIETQRLQQEVLALRTELARTGSARQRVASAPPAVSPEAIAALTPGALAWSAELCGKALQLSNSNRRVTKSGNEKTWTAAVLGTVPNPASYKVRVTFPEMRHSAMVGLAPRHGFLPDDMNHAKCGWYIHTTKGNLYGQDGVANKAYLDYRIESGAVIEVRFDRAAKLISFSIDGVCPGVAYRAINCPSDVDLYPAIALHQEGAAAELLV
eukprot:TRINITY_DN903_c0_g1_i11.p1 TRINITY_DN903_c0_g1~~TRINITY_DN903_c0_g1_i11.p1  ORF type:complete len:288 (+),score=50.65 TRINITY_DN903_c0_g1_i11:145-1008(+)